MTRSSRARLATALALVGFVLVTVPGLPGGVRAQDYEMDTRATYVVRPEDGHVDVTVDVTFENTTPDPEGRFSVFEEIKLAIHDDATEVAASDEDGELDVAVEVENEVNVATITLRDELRFEETAELAVTWQLPDTDDPQLRVRPSLVVFPAWGFGTSATVQVDVPASYEVRVDGDPLREEDDVLVSGEIEDPTRWLALVSATRPAEYVSFDASVPLSGGTADLSVRAFADDEAWGERVRTLVADALPLLEEEIGLPYPRAGQLVVTETAASSGGGFGDEPTDGAEILIAFDQPDFTVLHQVAHVWISPSLVDARWIREGVASHVAARVAAQLEVELPFDPAERAANREDAAFPLDTWSSDAGSEGEAYGYAASWAFLDTIADTVGDEALATVLGRVRASIGPYQSADVEVDPAPAEGETPATALTTRGFLDHLETVSGQRLDEAFAATVLTEEDVALLPRRAEAREAFDALVEAGGSWPAPDPVRGAMTAWEFDEALRQIDEASAWLAERDELLGAIQAAGLSAPDRLRQAYRTYGGGAEAIDELEAQRAVVDAYAGTAADVNAERSFLERVGLVAGDDPGRQLNLANGRFAEGDLRGALEAVAEAQRILDAAEVGGLVRIASAVVVALFVLGLAVLLVRRRASYTARP